MKDEQKSPLTRGDVLRHENAQGNTPGAHGNEGRKDDDRSGALGVSYTRKTADEILPEEDRPNPVRIDD